MGEVGRKVVELGEDDVREVVGVLCESFFDYPTMRFVLGPDSRRYENQLQTLVHFFVMARVLRGEVLLGIESDDGLSDLPPVFVPPIMLGIRKCGHSQLSTAEIHRSVEKHRGPEGSGKEVEPGQDKATHGRAHRGFGSVHVMGDSEEHRTHNYGPWDGHEPAEIPQKEAPVVDLLTRACRDRYTTKQGHLMGRRGGILPYGP